LWPLNIIINCRSRKLFIEFNGPRYLQMVIRLDLAPENSGRYESRLGYEPTSASACWALLMLRVHKIALRDRPDVRSQGERGFVQCGHFSDEGGSSDADVRTFLAQKNLGVFEIYVVSTRTGVGTVEPVRTFCGQGRRGVIFSRFCADVFFGRPLSISLSTLNHIN